MALKQRVIILSLLFLVTTMTPIASQEGSFHFANSQSSTAIPTFLKLGYGPGAIFSMTKGVPIYTTGDSMWISSTSNSVVSAQLISPIGTTKSSQTISTSTITLLYTFSAKDPEGNWTLRIRFENFSVVSIFVPFVNPAEHPVHTSLSNYSLQSGDLNLQYAISESDVFNFEVCLGYSNVNSTLVVPIPQSIGTGQMLINGNLHNATISIDGVTSAEFTFRYEMDYSYSFTGNLTGELVSRDIAVIDSSATIFTTMTPQTVSLTNNTSPRPGRYTVNAFFDTGSGLVVEQTYALLLSNGQWMWLGGCNPVSISSLSFAHESSLIQGPQSWPSVLYLTYEIKGVNAYSAQQLNFSVAEIKFVGSNPNASLSYLSFSTSYDSDILASNSYNASLYLLVKNFPIDVNVTASFGSKNLQSQIVEIKRAYDVNKVVIPVGSLSLQVTNNSVPLADASVVAENGFGGNVSAFSGSDGNSILYLPGGTYNVTVYSQGMSLSNNVTIAVYSESKLQFDFGNSALIGYFTYLLVSLLIVGFLLNVWLWILRPRKTIY